MGGSRSEPVARFLPTILSAKLVLTLAEADSAISGLAPWAASTGASSFLRVSWRAQKAGIFLKLLPSFARQCAAVSGTHVALSNLKTKKKRATSAPVSFTPQPSTAYPSWYKGKPILFDETKPEPVVDCLPCLTLQGWDELRHLMPLVLADLRSAAHCDGILVSGRKRYA